MTTTTTTPSKKAIDKKQEMINALFQKNIEKASGVSCIGSQCSNI